MIEHIVLFKFKAAITEAQKRELIRRLEGLRQAVEGIVQLSLHTDLLRTEESFDFGMFVTLADPPGLQRYGDHPERRLVSAYARSLCDQIALFDYEMIRE